MRNSHPRERTTTGTGRHQLPATSGSPLGLSRLSGLVSEGVSVARISLGRSCPTKQATESTGPPFRPTPFHQVTGLVVRLSARQKPPQRNRNIPCTTRSPGAGSERETGPPPPLPIHHPQPTIPGPRHDTHNRLPPTPMHNLLRPHASLFVHASRPHPRLQILPTNLPCGWAGLSDVRQAGRESSPPHPPPNPRAPCRPSFQA
ncbi:hypothetical protein BT67DRAFT_291291 [Trichocladium antarcticum]|uniref:Uncharacterized protein n=1 Tax=Trichocladium antarcticum TaxID=1450529 RepID=A0AAN6UL87_9PEZI|nr:hypothetical protein BT67DRAFT_291291 [Trichocladium antarcticum]